MGGEYLAHASFTEQRPSHRMTADNGPGLDEPIGEPQQPRALIHI